MSLSETKSIPSSSCHISTSELFDNLMKDPIKCGYLLQFAEIHFCSENISFILEVDRYRDFVLLDKNQWNKLQPNWRQIDLNNHIFAGEDLNGCRTTTITGSTSNSMKSIKDINTNTGNANNLQISLQWPSQVVSRDAIVSYIKKIWDKYINDDSQTQICMPSRVLLNTKRRLELLHLYGPDVFQEITIDPIKTLQRDLLPRFINSEVYKEMEIRLEVLYPLPKAIELNLDLPMTSSILEWQNYLLTCDRLAQMDILSIVNDRILYTYFLLYLQSIVASENLLALRAVIIYKSLFPPSNSNEIHESNVSTPIGNENYDMNSKLFSTYNPKVFISKNIHDMAWLIYRFFCASNSSLEISLSYRRRKEIQQNLAQPKFNTFDKVEKTCIQLLQVHYEQFSKSSEFQLLPTQIISEKKKRQFPQENNLEKNSLPVFGCLSFTSGSSVNKSSKR